MGLSRQINLSLRVTAIGIAIGLGAILDLAGWLLLSTLAQPVEPLNSPQQFILAVSLVAFALASFPFGYLLARLVQEAVGDKAAYMLIPLFQFAAVVSLGNAVSAGLLRGDLLMCLIGAAATAIGFLASFGAAWSQNSNRTEHVTALPRQSIPIWMISLAIVLVFFGNFLYWWLSA